MDTRIDLGEKKFSSEHFQGLFNENGDYFVPELNVWLTYKEQKELFELFKALLDFHIINNPNDDKRQQDMVQQTEKPRVLAKKTKRRAKQ